MCHLNKLPSNDHLPPPLISKKMVPSSIDQSVRLSCIIFQKPSFIRKSVFVVAMATVIIIISGMLANLVNNPRRIINPQIISKVATKYPRNSGAGSPIFSNLPGPRAMGYRYFWIPSDKKTAPVISLIRIVVCELSVDNNFFIIG